MTKEQRTAMARIISDMIKADNIIEESEIKDMKCLMSKYSITQQDMSDARNIRFSDAVTILQDMKRSDKQAFFDSIYKIALSDNVCVPKETLYLIALQYCLVEHDRTDANGNKIPKPYLISCPTSESSISDQYMVYLESSYDEDCNKEINKNLELLVTKSHLNGFNFVYIPKMVEEFKEMDSQYVKDVISYMAPHLNDNVISDVYNRLCKMTTTEFFHSVLYEKLHVKVKYDTRPSLLINIGTSVVPYCAVDGSIQYYTEFLCIPIATTALALVREILSFYQSKVSVSTITITESNGQFKYFGFYKALFDFLIAPPPIAPDLVFLGQDMSNEKYYIAFKFEEGRERKVHLTPSQYKLYLQIAIATYKSRIKGLSASQVDRTVVSRLRSLLMKELNGVSFVDQYKPERVKNAFILRVDKNKVYVRSYTTANHKEFTDVPITEYR
ncbi:MAG: hypothetical protein KBT27_08850 [Prevotellaceae bacterium]|nr:hypothetical protein [Candidatus Faecinaster equi]